MAKLALHEFEDGYKSLDLELPTSWRRFVEKKDWSSLDLEAQEALSRSGFLFKAISQFCPIHKSEHLISLRTAPDEQGIWHDDGSRELAFSLSLNLKPFSGKGLSLRKKGVKGPENSLGARPYGRLSLFLTGQNGYEHRTEPVLEGERLVIAGWIN